MEIINKLKRISDALDIAGNYVDADFIDRNMIVLAMLKRNKMGKIIREAGMAENEIQRLFLALLPGTKYANIVLSVGGYERDKAMGIQSNDLDIVVNNPQGGTAKEFAFFLHSIFPDETTKPWPKGGEDDKRADGTVKETYPIFGLRFDKDVEYKGIEYKTAGGDLDIADSQKETVIDSTKRDRKVEPGTLEEDNERRDFTVNMLMRDLTNGELIDLTGHSLQDIKEGVLRHKNWVSMERSFDEDPLRIMRLVRFKVKYGWHVPFYVLKAASKFSQRLKIVSWERITGELVKMAEIGKLHDAIEFMRAIGILHPVLPEVHAMVGLIQTHQGKKIDVYKHTLMVLSNAPPTIEGQFSALLHDVGKIKTVISDEAGKTKRPSHPKVGEDIARAVMNRLKFDKDTSIMVSKLVGLHMRPRKLQDASIKELRGFIREVGENIIESLLDLARADALGRIPQNEDYIPKLRKKLEEAMAIPIEDSVLDGFEIIELLKLDKKKDGKTIGMAKAFLKELADEKAEEGIVLDKETAEQAILEKFKPQNSDDPGFNNLIKEIESGEFSPVNTFTTAPDEDHYPKGSGPMYIHEVQ